MTPESPKKSIKSHSHSWEIIENCLATKLSYVS